jgi:hypothetical protein
LKVDQLLSRYLYEYKELSLPGIGTFLLDGNSTIPDEQDKQKSFATGIIYQKKPIKQIDDTLIDYIRANTGKIRPLALSDIESYLSLSSQLLNIGNPLHIEGIGTLVKTKEGDLSFSPGSYVLQRMEEPAYMRQQDGQERKTSVFEEDYYKGEKNTDILRKLIIGGIVIITIGLIAWGAYYLYSNNKAVNETALPDTDTSLQQVKIDTTVQQKPQAYMPDTASTQSVTPSQPVTTDSANTTPPPGEYRFVILNTTNKTRALNRYNQLLLTKASVKLETADSITFKLYFMLPATAADTSRIKDSLRRFYAANVTIDQ